MQVTIENTGDCARTLNIEIPADQVSEEYNRVLNGFRSQANIPGFRQGKAPQQLVQSRFHKQILEQVRDQLVPKSYREALEKEELSVVNVLQVSEVKLEKDAPLNFNIQVEVEPEFTLPEYKGIVLTKDAVAVTDEDVERTIGQVLEQQSKYVDVEDRVIEEGDLAKVDFESTVDGESLDSLDEKAGGMGEGKDFWVRIDENAFIPEFGTELPGVGLGETKEISVAFPEDFHLDALQGKTAEYKVTVTAIKTRELPEWDEELCKQLQVESKEEFETRVREDLVKQAENSQEGKLMDDAAKFLLDHTELSVPKSLVDQETSEAIQQIVSENAQRGMPKETLEEHKDEIYENAAKNAGNQVKMRFILAKIAEAENIAVDREELDQHLEMMGQMYGMSGADLKKRVVENQRLGNISDELRARKTLKHLVEIAKIS